MTPNSGANSATSINTPGLPSSNVQSPAAPTGAPQNSQVASPFNQSPTVISPAPTNSAAAATNAANAVNSTMTGTGNAAVNAGAARSGSVSTTDAIDSSLAGSAAVTGDVPRIDANTQNTRANSPAFNRPINSLASGSELTDEAANTVRAGETVRSIREASPSSRDALYGQVNSRLENTGRIVSDLELKGRELKGDSRIYFKSVTEDLRDKEKALKRSLNAVRRASNDNWSDVQARLASDYEAYASSVARAQAAASVNDGAATTTR